MILRPGKGKKVFVGVSGGVDSSVAALLLKLQGYDVTGVFIRTWQPEWIECTWRDERRDAMRVCAYLEIPFIELDLEDTYKRGVVDYMIAEYRAGRTPNPDVMCNREVKFGGFLQYAIDQGADYIATGHYARNGELPGTLLKGVDYSKDQSYFLWTLTKEQLAHSLFPVGGFYKSQIRSIARFFNLPTAVKKDSQGICFIGEIDMKDFLKHYITEQPGDVLDESGKVIGNHQGALFYTLGERHGFTITLKGTDDKPWYVTAKDISHNTITVSHNPHHHKPHDRYSINLRDVVFRDDIQKDCTYTAQIRYHGVYYPCEVHSNDFGAQIVFSENSEPVAPGQSIVIYDHNICIGGGIVF